ncbi:MAG TPA: hypothetical protein VMW19_11075 [Myxococcota bacterium]|nr:hypothetical protein [Myxococcota bacterium]
MRHQMAVPARHRFFGLDSADRYDRNGDLATLEFLYNSVTYVTRPGVIRMLRECGFSLVRKEQIDAFARDPSRIPTGWKRWLATRLQRVLSAETLSSLAFASQELRSLCASLVYEIVRKPA